MPLKNVVNQLTMKTIKASVLRINSVEEVEKKLLRSRPQFFSMSSSRTNVPIYTKLMYAPDLFQQHVNRGSTLFDINVCVFFCIEEGLDAEIYDVGLLDKKTRRSTLNRYYQILFY